MLARVSGLALTTDRRGGDRVDKRETELLAAMRATKREGKFWLAVVVVALALAILQFWYSAGFHAL